VYFVKVRSAGEKNKVLNYSGQEIIQPLLFCLFTPVFKEKATN
jgi:hypothetical protein